MHTCVCKLTTIGSDNGLSACRRQAIIWTNAAILLIGPLGTNFSEISIESHTFLFRKMHLKLSSRKWRPFCLCLNVLLEHWFQTLSSKSRLHTSWIYKHLNNFAFLLFQLKVPITILRPYDIWVITESGMARHPLGAELLPESMTPDFQMDPWGQTSVKFQLKLH